MTDINSKSIQARHDARPAVEEGGQFVGSHHSTDAQAVDLIKFVELLFFAYRDFTGDADELLSDLGYGRAHHRVIHFVARHPGLRVADLLDILRITKQSLARVLKQLIEEGFVTQEAGCADRRERHLFLTQKGLNFAEKLAKLQCARIGHALHTLAPEHKHVVEGFLFAMISDRDQAAVTALFEKATGHDHEQLSADSGRHRAEPASERSPAR